MKKQYIIHDWAGNHKFQGEEFRTITAASDFLEDQVLKLYPETQDNEELFYEQMNEYSIDKKEEN